MNCLVYSDLALRKAAKLKAVYKADNIDEYIHEAVTSLWNLDDNNLIMRYVISSQYSYFALLKSNVLLDMYINVLNDRVLKDMLELLLAKLEQVSVY